jgi:hypothetical protein
VKRVAVLAFLLGAFSSGAIATPAKTPSVWFYPVWITVPTETLDETITLQKDGYLTLFKLRPMEAYEILDPAQAKGGKKWLPVGAQLIRAPGPSFVACEAIRPKGNERFTCLLDDDLDGDFDRVHRPGAAANLFIQPLQFYRPKFDSLPVSVRYRALDEKAEFQASEFIMKYFVQGKINYVDFCLEPHRRKESWGSASASDSCYGSAGLSHELGAVRYPLTGMFRKNEITVLSFDETTKAMTFRVRRNSAELPITFSF